MNEHSISPDQNERMAHFFKHYWIKLNDAIQRQKTTFYGDNPILLASINQDLIKFQNWINIETTIL